MATSGRTLFQAAGLSVLVHLTLGLALSWCGGDVLPRPTPAPPVRLDIIALSEETGADLAYLNPGLVQAEAVLLKAVPFSGPMPDPERHPGAPRSEPFSFEAGPNETNPTPSAPLPPGISEASHLPSPATPVGTVGNSGKTAGDVGRGTQAAGAFFGLAPHGQRIVYVMDRSSSMGRFGALERAATELLASLRSLPATACFQVIVYNSTAGPLLPDRSGWLPATPEMLHQVALALQSLSAEGGTRHHLALPLALSLQPDVVFFLTDADDLPPVHVAEVTQRNTSRALIHTIELTGYHVGRPEMPLQELARRNGGEYRAVGLQP